MSMWWSPRMLGAHLLGLVCVSIAAGFGVWQFDAWQQRREAERIDLTRTEPVALSAVIGPDDPFPGDRIGQPVTIAGSWLSEGTVLVDGRDDAEGRAGRWVVTPVSVGGPGEPAIPVVRGWVAEGDVVPEPPAGPTRLVGWLQPPEGTGEVDEDPEDDVLPQLRIADLVQRVDTDLYGAYAVVDPAATERDGGQNAGGRGLQPATLDQLPSVGRFTALRNFLYGVEWFVFAAFAAFIWWRYVRDARAEASPAG